MKPFFHTKGQYAAAMKDSEFWKNELGLPTDALNRSDEDFFAIGYVANGVFIGLRPNLSEKIARMYVGRYRAKWPTYHWGIARATRQGHHYDWTQYKHPVEETVWEEA